MLSLIENQLQHNRRVGFWGHSGVQNFKYCSFYEYYITLYYITCHLADAFIQSNLQVHSTMSTMEDLKWHKYK